MSRRPCMRSLVEQIMTCGAANCGAAEEVARGANNDMRGGQRRWSSIYTRTWLSRPTSAFRYLAKTDVPPITKFVSANPRGFHIFNYSVEYRSGKSVMVMVSVSWKYFFKNPDATYLYQDSSMNESKRHPVHCRIHPQPDPGLPKIPITEGGTNRILQIQQDSSSQMIAWGRRSLMIKNMIDGDGMINKIRKIQAQPGRQRRQGAPSSKPKAPTYINACWNGKPWWISFCFSQSYLATYQVRHVIDIKPAQQTRPIAFPKEQVGPLRTSGVHASIYINGGFCLSKMANSMAFPSASIIPQVEREKWSVSPILISCFRKGSRAGGLRMSGLNASIHINGGFCLTKMANPSAISSASISPGSPQNRT